MGKPPFGMITVRRGLLASVAVSALLALAPHAVAQQIVPASFFSQVPTSSGEQMAVSANTMVFDSRTDTVVAQGNVGISFQGYRATADRAIYYQSSGRVELVGNVAFIDPDGIEYVADRVELEDGFREGFVQSLTVAFPDGTFFTAADTTFNEGVERVYNEGTYAPCGTCIDEDGNRIGWTVKAARIVTDESEQVIYFEQPSLQLLGVSVIALPWLSLPTDEDIELPVLSYDDRYGVGISLPFFRYRIADGSLAVTPTIYTNQGVGVAADWQQRVGDLSYTVNTSGVYQLNPGAYDGLGDRPVRGSLQTTGRFTGIEDWTLGWSYTTFTDPGYMPDYRVATGTQTNQVYGQYLTTETYADIRVQQFVPLGTFATWAAHEASANRQALTHPNARVDHVVDLDNDAGRVEIAGKLLGLTRAADDVSGLFDGRRYVHGYEGQSVHAVMQASWTNQYIVPGGLTVSPYLGLRGDAAGYDGASGRADAPEARSLLSATPIAALDVRYPIMARMTGATTVIEPIGQLVYRGGEAVPGITNNDSQTFVFEDTNLFSFNRFSGADRQETGLRANLGGQFQTSFDDGGWLGGILGQSFHLAGKNGFNVDDGTTAGVGSGMNADASYLVAGLQGGYGGLSGGAKAQFDPENGEIPRAQIGLAGEIDDYLLTANYVYIAENPTLGTTADRHEVQIGGRAPLQGYWTATGSVAWDLATNQWLETQAALEYDDSYLAFGAGVQLTGPTHRRPDDLRFGVNFSLSTAGRNTLVGFDYDFTEF
ncbi:LPS-assembly protein LptD [Pelagibacterium luteolum]|uniref:LPS-assembly protein LptD n=1 Tax=Pelagibacterium luteolum TaxID=440168 RepID=A0A1G7VV92_9HYPH|nr:LPS assembly protein LptD [Pelagibacterium luteolum]SDG63716.1 LPS-assembly protein [Pelagibacterium luteolum]